LTARAPKNDLTVIEHVGLSFAVRSLTMPLASVFRFLVSDLKLKLIAIELKVMTQFAAP
jgi:hypothetical protein